MQIPNNYPEKLISEANKYVKDHEGSEVFHFDYIDNTLYKDKSIVTTTYRIYILYGNLFKIMRYMTCSKPEWNYDEVTSDSMIAWEIKMCHEKSELFRY